MSKNPSELRIEQAHEQRFHELMDLWNSLSRESREQIVTFIQAEEREGLAKDDVPQAFMAGLALTCLTSICIAIRERDDEIEEEGEV